MWFVICAEGMLHPSVKDKVQQLLCDASMGDLAKWKSVSKFLMDEKVMYKMKLRADELLVHPQNRGGMGLQVFSMHAKGQRILQCGCDLSLLGGSTCIELNPDPIKRQAQCKMMQSLHAAHPEYVAPVSGHERYMSLSSSHVSQFFKAMLHGCKSPEADLVDAKSGKMSLALVSDPEFLQGATEGWEWTVIPFYVEDACHKFLCFLFSMYYITEFAIACVCGLVPSTQALLQDTFQNLPNLVQGALNACNVCYEAVGEVELVSTIALKANQMTQDGVKPDFQKIAQLSAAGSVGLYAPVLGKFVQSFGGGAPFDIIKYLASFAHQDKAVTLGKEFVMAITDCEFSSVHLFPLVRIAFAVANLTAPKQKVQDGFSRLLTRTDVLALKSKKLSEKLLELESLMEKAWKEASLHANQAIAYKAFGKFQVRSLLHLTKKSKHGHEEKTYADVNEIYNLFVDEIKATQATGLQQHASSTSASPSASQISFDQAKDPMYLASLKMDLKLGTLCTHKDHPHKIFQIKDVNPAGIQLQFIDPITGYQELVEVEASKVLQFVKNTKSKLQKVMDAAALEHAFANIRCQKEMEKCQAYIALMQMYNNLDCDSSHIQVLSGLSKIFANQNFKKGDLTLVPITSSASLLSHDKPKESFAPFLEHNQVRLYIMQPKAYKEAKPDDGGIVAPFFIAKHDDENGNLEYSFVEHKGLKALCLVNKENIKNGDELLIKTKLKDFMAKLEGAPMDPPKKRRKA